ncbi:ATP-dependent DNA helicase DinG [Peribacillus alkalitolerans]|uniref:ATP-dependent DNA helicase DinG n=1 Tax=Peribacillus alkalitolerans TaxID=1550385 RepID=UPI0013D24D80|nr:ATP-dependent DNA helicase DinG [Peribacillus alkalitolerans]
MAQRYVVVDLETTGNSPKKGDRIIQFAGVVIEDGLITEQFSTYINPGRPISIFIEELTGINDSMVKDSPTFDQVAPQIISLLHDACFVAHNVLFDLSFLQDELIRCGFDGFYGSTIDTVELARIMRPTADSYKLSSLAEKEGFNHDRPHQADSDALVTAQLFIKLYDDLKVLPLVTLKHMLRLSYSLKSEISELLTTIVKVRMTHKVLHHDDISVFRGIALKDWKENELQIGNIPDYPSENELKMEYFKKAFYKAEERQDQLKMMDLVYKCMTEQKSALIEAGTGLGKTLGYLLPAAFFSRKYNQPVIISTNTLQLQGQLWSIELPKLESMVPFPLKSSILKGKNNYLSLPKFERALKSKDNHYDTALAKLQILVWLTITETGDKDELNFSSGGELFWEKLQYDNYIIPAFEAPWKPVDFYSRAKHKAQISDLIFTNHSFLMADLLSTEESVIRDGIMIIDEAHQLENAASRFLGENIDYDYMKMMLNKWGTFDQRQLFYKGMEICKSFDPSTNLRSTGSDSFVQDIQFEMDELFYMVSNRTRQKLGSKGFTKENILLKSLWESERTKESFVAAAERLSSNIKKLVHEMQKMIDLICVNEKDLNKNIMYYISEANLLVQYFTHLSSRLIQFAKESEKDYIIWVEFNKNSPHHGIRFFSQPIYGGKNLWHRFFSNQKCNILTSSTLTTGGSFQFIKNQLGLSDIPLKTAIFPSPFAYKEKVKLLIPVEISDINSVSNDEYVNQTVNHISLASFAAKGRTLVLFNSYDMLRKAYVELKSDPDLSDFNIFAQGITGGSRTRIIRNFQSMDKAILLGTASFWEGVDIPGEKLSSVIMVRLPFSSPTEPITEARSNDLKDAGKNPFSSYSLPEAILRFKQGFGRLIRTEKDKGLLIVLDRRIITTEYGKSFIKSIPKVDIQEVKKDEMVEIINNWLF